MTVRLRSAASRSLRHPMVRKMLDSEIDNKCSSLGGSQIHTENATKAHADERDGFAWLGEWPLHDPEL